MSRSPGNGYTPLSTSDGAGSEADSDEKETFPAVVGVVAPPAAPTARAPQAPALPPCAISSPRTSDVSAPAPAAITGANPKSAAPNNNSKSNSSPSSSLPPSNLSSPSTRAPPPLVSRSVSAPIASPRPPIGRPSPGGFSGVARNGSGGDKPGGTSPDAVSDAGVKENELWIRGSGGTEGGPGRGGQGLSGSDGFFHDAQDVLMPTLSVYDPERLWEYVERPMMVYMPLRKLSAKPPAVSSPKNIDELPVRCLVHRTLAGTEVAARLVDSPAERYRASFAFVYMVSAESQEHYKQTVRPLIREWVDKVEARAGGADGGGWLLLYLIVAPQGSGSSAAAAAAAAAVEAQGKIFWWLCADFYSKTPGDRCSLVSLYVDQGAASADKSSVASRPRPRPSASPRHHPKQWSDLLEKVGGVVMEVFEARVACYNAELGRLDATRGMIGWDFGEFFVVKESLALMFKEMQLPAEALLKYQELAALILTMGEDSASLSRSSSVDSGGSDAGRESGAKELLFGLGVAGQPDRLPASVLDYGRMRFRERVNGGRLHSLVLETQLYIFARQCALNLDLKKPAEVARMGGRFMPAYHVELVGQAVDRGGDEEYASPDDRQALSSASSLDPIEVELFAFKSSWDVVKACDRYFARALNPNGLEPPTRELVAIRQARAETSRYLSELLEFAQARLLDYARLVAADGISRGITSGGEGGGASSSLLSSCVFELQRHGFLASQRDWVPQMDDEYTASSSAREWGRGSRSGRMRVGGGVVEVETLSGQFFWDPDEEGEVFIPPQEGGIKPTNPIKALTGGDGVPSPRRSMKTSSLMADFDDEDSDETEGSVERSSTVAASTPASGTPGTGMAAAVASAVASTVATVTRPLRSAAFPPSPATAGDASGSDGDCPGHRLDHPRLLEDAYLQLTHSLAQHNQRAGRVRAAARCWGKRAELLLERGEVGVAQARLSSLADLYQTEGWLPQAFWTLHRLARCRFTIAFSGKKKLGAGGINANSTASYVSTVMRLAALLKDPRVRSEGGVAAVERAAAALLCNAHAVASAHPAALSASTTAVDPPHRIDSPPQEGGEGHVYRLQCFSDVKLAVVVCDRGGGEGGKKCVRLRNPGPLPVTHVGDTVRVSCVLTSHLPEPVTLDGLELEMTYEGRYSGGREADRANHRRATTAIAPTATPQRSLRRLESVATITGFEDKNVSTPSSPAGTAPPAKFRPPPPVVTATRALTVSIADADASIGPAAADRDLITSHMIVKTRSHSLSPRGNSSPSKNMFGSVGGGGNGGDEDRAALPRAGRSRSPRRLARGSLPGGVLPGTARAPTSRLLRHQRSRPVCTSRIDGPVQLSPGETEVVFALRPAMPGVITASRVSAVWGGVRLVEVLPPGGRGSGGSIGGGNSSVVALPSASAVVRPFRPQATLEVVPPQFLPAACGGWVRVVIATGPDRMRGARLRLGVGQALAWGAVALARIRSRPVASSNSDGANGSSGGEETQANASVREDPAEISVELPEVMQAGWRVEVFLRLLSTAAATPHISGVRVSDPSATPKNCTVKAEVQAWHSRGSAGSSPAGAGNKEPRKGVDEVGVECHIRARTVVVATLPFEARAMVTQRPGGVVLAEAALVCLAPVALALRSCKIADLEPGATVMADPNAYLSGEVLPPGQPLRLAACLRRENGGGFFSLGSASEEDGGGPAPVAVLRLQYTILSAAAEKADDSRAKRSREGEEFVFDVAIPGTARSIVNASRSHAANGRPGNSQPSLTITTLVEPVNFRKEDIVSAAEASLIQLNLAEPRAFDFGVDVADGSEDAAQLVTFQVAASLSDWMVSGLVRGSAELGTKGGRHILCRVHLVPIRSGLLPLPRLEVTANGGGDDANIVVWTLEERKVLVLPSGDATSVCQARPP